MKVVACVPIKLNNERFPGKNTRILGDKPLINYILNTLDSVEEIDEIYVYCSSADIVPYLPKTVTFLQRDKSLDLPSTKFADIQIPFSKTVPADIYVLAHATSPFLSRQTIKSCVSNVVSGLHDSAFTAEIIQDFLWKDGKPLNFEPDNIPRTQDLPIIYKESTGVYVYKNEVLTKTKRRIGSNPHITVISGKETVDIDYFEDFELAEYYLSKAEGAN